MLKGFEDTTYSVETRVDDMMKLLQEGELASINIILKGDTNGSVEAIKDGLNKNVMSIFDVKNSVDLKTSYGGTSTKNIKKMISKLRKEFKQWKK